MKKHIVVIPAAGAGNRFHELGKQYPKCLLPYENKLIISHLIDKVVNDIYPDEIVVVVKQQDLQNPLWQCLTNRVTFKVVDNKLAQGPATSIYCGLRDVQQNEEYRVTIVLSDMILKEKFPLSKLKETNNCIFVYSSVEFQSRWCISAGGKFYDKPTKEIENGKALLGVYSFSSGKCVTENLKTIVETSSSETQLSFLLSKYSDLTEIVVDKTSVVDLGTLEEYLQNRPGIAPRSFNTLQYTNTSVTKSSTKYPEKIRREALWLMYPPEEYSMCVPQVYSLQSQNSSFTMERIHDNNLREIALYHDKSYETWAKIFSSIWKILDACKKRIQCASSNEFRDVVVERTRSRNPEGRFHDFYRDLYSVLTRIKGVAPYHGDLHFANIFWSNNSSRIRVVDPRGEYWGHWIYDVAKLTQCVLGRYDYIEEDLYTINGDRVAYYDSGHDNIERAFEDKILCNLTSDEKVANKLLTAGLYLSMCPLHESREHQFLFVQQHLAIYKK